MGLKDQGRAELVSSQVENEMTRKVILKRAELPVYEWPLQV